MFFGGFWYQNASNAITLHDLTAREIGLLTTLAVLTLLLGLFPNLLFSISGPTVQSWFAGIK